MFDLTIAIPQAITRKKSGNLNSLYRRNLLLAGLILFFGIFYLFEVNALSTKGYEIKTLERKHKTLGVEQKHLEIQASNLQSISRIKQVIENNNFVPVKDVTYIKDSDFALK